MKIKIPDPEESAKAIQKAIGKARSRGMTEKNLVET